MQLRAQAPGEFLFESPAGVQVLQRRWAVTFGEPPRPRQQHEGQLTLNALRATAMLLATHGTVFCDPSPPEIFDKLHDAYQGLLSSMRTALLTPPETVAAAFGAGCIAQVSSNAHAPYFACSLARVAQEGDAFC